MRFFYNADHPLEILQKGVILPSVVCGRCRGVSFSEVMLDCHGAFTFVFKEDRSWYSQFQKCVYGDGAIDETHKPLMFVDEQEWWSPTAVKFDISDVEQLVFRSKSPAGKRNYGSQVVN